MPTRPLLPGTWNESTDDGLRKIDSSGYQQLYAGSPFEVEGIPSPWAAAIWFTRALAQETLSDDGVNGPSCKKLWDLFFGLYLNVLQLEQFPLNETHPFSQLLKAGYEHPGNNFKLYGIWFDRGHEKVIVGGTYPDCLLFPAASVREDIFEEIAKEIEIALSNLDRSGYLEELRAGLRSWVNIVAHGVPNGQERPWLKFIRAKTADWQAGNNPAVSTAMPVLKSTGDAIPRNVDFPFYETTEKWKMLTHGVVCFTDGKKKVLPDIPVRPECISEVDTLNSHYYQYQGTHRWLVKFGDGTILPSVCRKVEIEGKGSIFVWPNFYEEKKENGKEKGEQEKERLWRVNYVAVYLDPKIGDLRVRGIWKDEFGGYKISQEPLTSTQMDRVDGLELIAIERVLPGVGPTELGVFYLHGPGRQSVKSYRGHGTLALDFGTTNTCLAFKRKASVLQDKTVDILGFDYLGEGKTGKPRQYWLPTSGVDSGVRILPSEIVFRKPITEIKSKLANLLPTRDFTIWSHDSDYPGDLVVGNFKWDLPDDSDLQGNEGDLVQKYLEFVMEMALAEVDVAEVDLKFTYPLAFSEDQAKGYWRNITKIANPLYQRTGIKLNCGADSPSPSSYFMIGESYAGLFGTDYGSQDGCFLTVDLGGGSTDIALIRKKGSGDKEVVFSDSIRYGGKDLIDFLTADRVWNGGAWSLGGSSRGKRDRLIQQTVCNTSVNEIRNRLRNAQSKLSDIETGVDAFFRGLVEYLSLLLRAMDKRDEVVKLVPLGKGWGLLALAGKSARDAQTLLQTEYGIPNVEVVDLKEGVDPKEVVALGANNLDETPPASYDIKTILGWEESKYSLRWQEKIPCTTIKRETRGGLSLKTDPPGHATRVQEYLNQHQGYKQAWLKFKDSVEASFRDSITPKGILRGFFGHFLSAFHVKNLGKVLP